MLKENEKKAGVTEAMSIDYRNTYRTLEKTLSRIERSVETLKTIAGILEAVVGGPGPSMGITGARLYKHDPENHQYELIARHGQSGEVETGFRISCDYTPVRRAIEEGLVILEEGDPGFDSTIEARVGVRRFAAIVLGSNNQYLIGFTIGRELDLAQAVYLLATIRHIINLKLELGEREHDLQEARRIQLSLLPEKPPDFHGYDFAARSIPAEEVGGDLYDFIRLSPTCLGVAIADSSGHGLPAALMARDVITGLRCVLDIQYKLTRAVERVNRVVARSALASRFITLFYCEFESSGTMVYCNAGHPPVLLFNGREIRRLDLGGLVLGPRPEATYERGFESFPPGSVLLLYTDGIIEAENEEEEQFGIERLEALLRDAHDMPAVGIVGRIYEEVDRFSPIPRRDDQTVVVVRRPLQ
jgi:serine phosphatase RsbU (regulator of sigma subunit)